MSVKLTEAELRPLRRLCVGARRGLEEIESCEAALNEAGLTLRIMYFEHVTLQRAFVYFDRSGLQVAYWAIHSGKVKLYRPYGQKVFDIRDGRRVAAFVIRQVGEKSQPPRDGQPGRTQPKGQEAPPSPAQRRRKERS